MVYDEEGYGACVPSGSMELDPVLVDDLLQYVAYEADGDYIVLATQGPGKGTSVSAGNMMKKYHQATVHIAFGVPERAFGFVAALLNWPQMPGASVMWSCKSVYDALGLDQFSKQPWRWTFASVPKWQRYMADFNMQSHVLRSVQSEVVRRVRVGNRLSLCCVQQFIGPSLAYIVGEPLFRDSVARSPNSFCCVSALYASPTRLPAARWRRPLCPLCRSPLGCSWRC